MAKKPFGFIFWLHLVLNILAYISPFLFNWKLIVLGIILLQIQYFLIGGCYLSELELGKNRKESFFSFYFKKFGINFNEESLDFHTKYTVQFIILILALIWQIWLEHRPFWF
jgi:hypothetical protein